MKTSLWLSLILAGGLLPAITSSSSAATNGFLTAVLRSGCTSAPSPPPPVGQTSVGPGYVIKTVANGDPLDYQTAQQIVTDAVFESLMPLYCGLPQGGCVTNRVQWNLVTYDEGGNPRISGSPLSGAGFHYCEVLNGYITAVIRGESAVVPPPPPVGQVAVGTDAVIMTIADGDPTDLGTAQRLATDTVFETLMRRYCALPRGTGSGYVSGQARWTVATYDASGSPRLSGCAASGCDFHECVVSRGFITAVLRSGCTSAPTPPPPVGGITVGPDFVMMTVADGDPLDYQTAQLFATDAVFESLMPFYCDLAQASTNDCVTDRVQWNLLTYDAGGNPKVSGSPASGPGYHNLGPCSLTPQEQVHQLIVWVNVDVAAGILSRRDGNRLTTMLEGALRQLDHGNNQNAVNNLKRFLTEVEAMVQSDRLSPAAAQPLVSGALSIIAELGN